MFIEISNKRSFDDTSQTGKSTQIPRGIDGSLDSHILVFISFLYEITNTKVRQPNQ